MVQNAPASPIAVFIRRLRAQHAAHLRALRSGRRNVLGPEGTKWRA